MKRQAERKKFKAVLAGCPKLYFQEYGEGENQEFSETDAAMEVVAASVLLSYKLEVNKSGLFHSLRSK